MKSPRQTACASCKLMTSLSKFSYYLLHYPRFVWEDLCELVKYLNWV